MTEIDDLTRLKHIRDSALTAIEFTEGRSRDDLDSDRMLSLASVRLIEIIGEAANRISFSCRAKYPDIPWREIIGMRNRIVHAYFDVDLDIVWTVIREDLPSLLESVNGAIQELEDF
jgi:uncharacterized protein with HEPN domain